MPFICYINKKFSAGSREIISNAKSIIIEFANQGFDLTLRQLYYQFVARDLIPNKQSEYKRLGSIINDARLAGEIDWDTIVDRTRELKRLATWESPADILQQDARCFRLDKWEGQKFRPEVWIEKDALVGVIQRVCHSLQVPYFSCRGYTSQSEMWAAACRLIDYAVEDQIPFIIHLGDHDPSGIDMSRDIMERLKLFMDYDEMGCDFKRIALNMDQVQKYNPPPNPTKITDSRAPGYIKAYGNDSWELDALKPQVLSDLIRKTIMGLRNEYKWTKQLKREQEAKDALQFTANNWDRILAFSKGGLPTFNRGLVP